MSKEDKTKLNFLTFKETQFHREAIAGKLQDLFKKKCKKVLLVQPLPFTVENFEIHQAKNKRYYNWPPYGLGVLCNNLKNRGYETDILDLNYEVLNYIDRSEKEYDDEEAQRDIAVFWRDKTKKIIDQFQPDTVALTCMFTMGHEMLCHVSDFIRNEYPDIPIFAGGVHLTNAPEYVLREAPSIDFGGTFEGDASFPDVLDVVNGKAGITKLNQISTIIDDEYKGLTSRSSPSSDNINAIPDYCSLPIGRYSTLGEVGSYRSWLKPNYRGASVVSNRGCRARCSFCSVRNFNGKSVRARDLNTVIKEITGLKNDHKIDHIVWIDDDLLYDQRRSIDLFNKMDEQNLNVTWCASNGLIASAVAKSDELVDAMARSGCIGMTFGLESGSDKILKEVHKPSRVVHYYKVGEIMKKYPQVFTRGFLIIGFPNETLSQMMETVKMAQDVGLDWYGIQLLSPLPSTEIYDTMVELGLIDDVTVKANKDKKENSKLFVVRHGENQRAKEEAQKEDAKDFKNPFKNDNLNTVPTREDLHDIWLLVDYWINYEPILTMTDERRLEKKRAILTDICDRMTKNNPISNLFLGIVEDKLGNIVESTLRKEKAKDYLSESEYWKKQFSALKIHNLLQQDVI